MTANGDKHIVVKVLKPLWRNSYIASRNRRRRMITRPPFSWAYSEILLDGTGAATIAATTGVLTVTVPSWSAFRQIITVTPLWLIMHIHTAGTGQPYESAYGYDGAPVC